MQIAREISGCWLLAEVLGEGSTNALAFSYRSICPQVKPEETMSTWWDKMYVGGQSGCSWLLKSASEVKGAICWWKRQQ